MAPAEGGAWSFPDGKNFYEYALRRTTTTKLSADEIHDLGLKEVARIHGEMRKIMQQVKLKATCRRSSSSCGPIRSFTCRIRRKVARNT
jgi:uncharacterized protein (DUF885 family)